MYARVQRFNLAQGFAELAEELADQIEPIMRQHAGFDSLTLLSDETSGEYIFLTFWQTIEQIDAFDRSADEWRVRDIMSPHLTAVPTIEVYQIHNMPTIGPAGAERPRDRPIEVQAPGPSA